jgi:hypothetical protein
VNREAANRLARHDRATRSNSDISVAYSASLLPVRRILRALRDPDFFDIELFLLGKRWKIAPSCAATGLALILIFRPFGISHS